MDSFLIGVVGRNFLSVTCYSFALGTLASDSVLESGSGIPYSDVPGAEH